MTKELEIVRNVYFDTSILIRLPLTAPSPDFLNLKDSCDVFETKLLIPELVLKEYINHNKREVFTRLSNIRDSLRVINDRVSSTISLSLPEEEPLLKETEELMKKKITDLGIEVFKIDISTDKLEELALKEILFKDRSKKKGLRDSIILLSILEHAKNFPEFLNIFIVDDNMFQTKDAESMIESYKANVKIIKSLPEARDIIDETITDFAKAIRESREQRLKFFLDSQSSKIIDFVRRGQFNSFRLALGEAGESPLGGTIERINAIDYESIHSARLPQGYAEKEEKRVKISFMVRVKFTVVVRIYIFPSGDQLRLEQADGQPIDVQEQLLGITPIDNIDNLSYYLGGFGKFLDQNRREQTIFRNISVEASALLKLNDKEEEYSDLVLERVIT